jgi:hypothetical protein
MQLKATEEERQALSDAYEKTTAELRDVRSSLTFMQTHTQSGQIKDDWQRIVENAAALEKLEKTGISIKEVGAWILGAYEGGVGTR